MTKIVILKYSHSLDHHEYIADEMTMTDEEFASYNEDDLYKMAWDVATQGLEAYYEVIDQ